MNSFTRLCNFSQDLNDILEENQRLIVRNQYLEKELESYHDWLQRMVKQQNENVADTLRTIVNATTEKI